ncbi:DnaD domain protein [Pelotomaculum terephthalicicum JT]|uniref:DnaD domain-containing protein n=1 Tax=Pelotomaculum TaxID=191373 RepID=UPI0009C4C862|nr:MULTISPECIES: DnaD domain protein [Pelotomaculum]MCG9967251.1 DnaD domain protein [Pelotomaculum terephthalicicum JT]OPX88648.1 MAG: DNA replication protein DnaD [Pelotomaculum sp. PtaB.Bin117]OPY63576.1 MAG: DNA replication protein DnaD [Pelotomaculum sp. PtaU1.Bin065]
MIEWHKEKIIKCDQKVNITAAFGSELVLEGSTAIPNILLKIYNKIGISDFQMIMLIQMIRLYVEEKELYPSPEKLADCMEADPARIEKELAGLMEKEIIAVSEYFDSERKVIFEGYDFEPLFLKISDIWAGIRAKDIEESERLLRITVDGRDFDDKKFDDSAAALIPIFENEFGRALSPLEIEQIEQWAEERDPRLVVEALKQAVLRGKHNFKYINTILMGWKKNNLRTLEEVADYDREFQSRRSSRTGQGGETGKGGLNKADRNNSRKKAFIKTLYI